ncbi:hypothetical protein PPYR_09025 [Photinus pyralis]|uniref:Gustatory receptor n=1 Tax=Photinus pyralis TaxID=7054 RepID=A0A5N4AL04_PHOPY|nr:hypothetical protein PPYR_09025 [Photinus pyralis]
MQNKVHDISQFSPNENYLHFTLQYLIKNVLTVAQCFAILPVSKTRENAEDLQFEWRSFKTTYAIFAILSVGVYSLVVLLNSIATSEGFLSFGMVVIWNVRSFVALLVFLRLAQKWPNLLQEWTRVEIDMLCYGALPTLKLRFIVMPIAFLIAGLVEHFTYVYAWIRTVSKKIQPQENFTRLYYEYVYDGFFDTFGYAPWKVLYVEFVGAIITFAWQFVNILIILMSSTLAERFRQLNRFISKEECITETQWRRTRKHYTKLSILCKKFNETFSSLILLSYSANVYFFSISIFQSMSVRSTFEAIFVWFNVIFIFIHFSLVSLYGAWVYEESVDLIPKLTTLQLKHVNHEVERLLVQMANNDNGVSGAGFFKVTRSVILQALNVVVTLQLIFVQFQATFATNVQ